MYCDALKSCTVEAFQTESFHDINQLKYIKTKM